jgi:thiamine biosynthesis lipoprotein
MKSSRPSRQIRFSSKSTFCREAKLAALGISLALLSSIAAADWFEASRELYGETVSVQIWGEDATAASRSIAAVFAEVDRIQQLMGSNVDNSVLSAINQRAGQEAVVVDHEVLGLVVRALDISVLTRGAFDITFESVGQHYDFDTGRQPDEATRQRELVAGGFRAVKVSSRRQTIQFTVPGVKISLGGILNGYSVERALEILIERGVEHAIVTAGGDSKVLGDRFGSPWVVGIRHPRNPAEEIARLPLSDEAISTSGDYVRYFQQGDQRIHHIIEPTTGLPAFGVRSATVIGPDAVITDALATSVFVLGVDKGIRLLATLPDYEGVIIDSDGELHYSEGLVMPALPENTRGTGQSPNPVDRPDD